MLFSSISSGGIFNFDLQGVPKKTEPPKINYVFAEIIIHNNVIIIDNCLMNLTFLCLWDFILFVQYKSKQNKLKVLSYTDFVFNNYLCGFRFFWDTQC